VNAKQSSLEASVTPLAAATAMAPVSENVGSEQFAPPAHGLLIWLDNWFRTSPEERMCNDYMAYWS
jgi:hypothetical protein